jgi:hypothetical protein
MAPASTSDFLKAIELNRVSVNFYNFGYWNRPGPYLHTNTSCNTYPGLEIQETTRRANTWQIFVLRDVIVHYAC